MIETECFKELNVYYLNGFLVPDLRTDDGGASASMTNNSKTGFFSKFFNKKKVRS